MRGIAEENKAAAILGANSDELEALGFGWDGDTRLVHSVLTFSRMLLENCGNRSLYNSSDRIGDILNTTDLSLLADALHLAVRLAQRYHASRQRGANASQHLNNALLASHYSIDLDKVQKLANPFVKSLPLSSVNVDYPSTPMVSPTAKGKEKAHTGQASSVPASDMLAMARNESTHTNGSVKHDEHKEKMGHREWEDWGGVLLKYYQTSTVVKEEKKVTTMPTSALPNTPTPTRRASGLSRQARLSTSDDVMETPSLMSPTKPDDSAIGGLRTVMIPFATISTSPMNEVVESAISSLPKEHHYELLTKVRVASALSSSLATRQEILGIRLLAITNLAYIYTESQFQQKILQQDSDEPRRLQLVYQLTDLIHPSANRGGIPTKLQTLALGALEAFSKHKTKAPDVCAALNINVKHGVLFFALRKATADLAVEELEDEGVEGDEWREALFSLLDALPASTPRTGETLIAAGLLEILIEILTLRTAKAERSHPRVLGFLNTIIYNVRDAFQTLANSKGLDTISDLIAYEVQSSLQRAINGQGLPPKVRNYIIDYQIPFFQQQTLRWLFKFVNHMMSHGSGNFDRLLRNLIDSSQLLSGLQTVIVNAKIFGSSVWSGAVNIMSAFIHNEPTSYAVIAEAGLSKGLLEAITSEPPSTSLPSLVAGDLVSAEALEEQFTREKSEARVQLSEKNLLAKGILPATDAIVTIPQAFGAICLNNAGIDLFMKSNALDKFFEVFESPDHVSSMNIEGELARLLGNSFDELVRHHPRLKQPVMLSVMAMVRRVGYLCRSRAARKGVGVKLWAEGNDAELLDSAEIASIKDEDCETQLSSAAEPPAKPDDDVVMTEESNPSRSSSINTNTNTVSPSKVEGPVDQEDEKLGPTTSTYINVAMKFLSGFFENTTLCGTFIEQGGVEFVLDFATLPSLQYDFNNQAASQEIARVVHMLAEQKPYLVLPSLIKRAQSAADELDAFSNHADGSAFFAEFTTANQSTSNSIAAGSRVKTSMNGSSLVKSLVHIHTLCVILYETFSLPIYNSRSSHTLFSQVNLADMYVALIGSLGRLHRACVWEEILLQKCIPERWKEATRIKGYGMGSEEADEIFGFLNRHESHDETSAEDAHPTTEAVSTESSYQTGSTTAPASSKKAAKASLIKEEKTAQFRNVRTLRFLLSQIPSSIIPFFQGLGKALIAKRRPEAYARQNACLVAKAMSESTLGQLKFEAPRKASSTKDRYAYWIVILTSMSQLITEGTDAPLTVHFIADVGIIGPVDRPHSQCLTLVLHAFKEGGGLDAVKDVLGEFLDEVKSFSGGPNIVDVNERAARLNSAYGGIKIILNFYAQITTSKSIIEAAQTAALNSNDRDRTHAHCFSPPQFLVELRMAVLPIIVSIWESDFMDQALGSIVKCVIEILRTILEGGEEHGAIKRGDKLPAHGKSAPPKIYSLRNSDINSLVAKGYDIELAREALYRCMNLQNAEDYCRAHKTSSRMSRNPIPSYDKEKQNSPSPSQTPQRDGSEITLPDSEHSAQPDDTSSANQLQSVAESLGQPNPQVEVAEESNENTAGVLGPPPPAPGVPAEIRDGLDGMSMNIDNLLNLTQMLGSEQADDTPPPPAQPSLVEAAKLPELVTLNDLDEERANVRRNLIDRALDVLNDHDDVTFELADLINAAATKAADAATMRREIGETLVQSLISFQMDEDFRPNGKKVAAYANLLALVLQNPFFYDATFDELKSNFGPLLGFIKIFPDHTAEEPSPWIGQILLIIEKILAQDVQPSQIQWTPPSIDDQLASVPIVDMEASVLPMSEKTQLFEAILDILPRIGKDESLVLSVIRTLVILTRNRDIASKLGEKRNIQRLFVMIKQLAGITNDKVQSSFMLLLRHMVEDEETIRQIMRSEIVANFDTRANRPADTTAYVRQMYHLALRSPKIFVEVTNEKLEIPKYDANQRPQVLVLKPEAQPMVEAKEVEAKEVEAKEDEAKEPSSGAAESPIDTVVVADGQVQEEGKPLNVDGEKPPLNKAKVAETKAPVVEHPSGVIHYLLCELLSYKDVEDKDPVAPAKERMQELSPLPASETSQIGGSSTASTATSTPAEYVENNDNKKSDKTEFRADQHPIYLHRCFILQCLTELLHCYNRAKIEFINFSRKADPKAMTPSKPRSGVLNYLLTEVVPIGSLEHDDSISSRKKASMSNWAMSAIVSLCLRTNENGYEKKRGSVGEEDESELLFVRKFVLEHALKAYKDANSSEDPLDIKYARLLSLADLFNRILSGKLVQNGATLSSEIPIGPQKALAKLMFEKNFISALTGSIADIDLNFPGSKRAVKYILRPLKQLTQTAIVLSETSSISSAPGQTDDDEISTASSVSEVNHEREETPDLFRNSTLGMFEPGREEESSSESSDGDEDEDMYDEYEDEGMQYADEMERDGDEVISDEEEIEGAGPMEGMPGDAGMDVEVVIDGDDDEPSDDDEEGSDDMDEDDEVEVIDEITGDSENDSLADDEEEWRDEDEEEHDHDEDGLEEHDLQDAENAAREIVREFGGAGAALQHLENPEFAADLDGYMDEVVRNNDEEEEDDEGTRSSLRHPYVH